MVCVFRLSTVELFYLYMIMPGIRSGPGLCGGRARAPAGET